MSDIIPPYLQDRIQPRVLGLIQEEIGVLTTSLFTERAKVECLEFQRLEDMKIIETLKQQVSLLESERIALQTEIKTFSEPVASKSRAKRPRPV